MRAQRAKLVWREERSDEGNPSRSANTSTHSVLVKPHNALLNADVERQPLDLSEAIPALAGNGWRAMVRGVLDRLLGINNVREVFRRAAESKDAPFEASLRGFGVRLEAIGLENIPVDGPVCLMANHPLGGADALALGTLCEMRRPAFHLLANRMAASLPGISPYCLPLSIMGNDEESRRSNASTLRKVLSKLREGTCIAVFPSGEVAHWTGHGVVEGPWSHHILALAKRAHAVVVPVNFHASAPVWFHLLGAAHPIVRSALIPRVALASSGMSLRATVGKPIHPGDALLDSPADLRAATLRLTDPGA